MAKYKAKSELYLGKGVTIRAGEEFSSGLTPGRNWQPLDAAAIAAVKARFGNKAVPSEPAAEDKKEPAAKEAEAEPKSRRPASKN